MLGVAPPRFAAGRYSASQHNTATA